MKIKRYTVHRHEVMLITKMILTLKMIPNLNQK